MNKDSKLLRLDLFCPLIADDYAPIEELGLSVRTYSALAIEHIMAVGQLKRMTKQDLLKFEYVGEREINEIETKVKLKPASTNNVYFPSMYGI